MRTCWICPVVAVGLLFCMRCGAAVNNSEKPTPTPNSVVMAPEIKLYGLTTIGNHSYIPINLYGQHPSDRSDLILRILKAFEEEHPELEMTGWKLEFTPLNGDSRGTIYGIWVDHKPRMMASSIPPKQ